VIFHQLTSGILSKVKRNEIISASENEIYSITVCKQNIY